MERFRSGIVSKLDIQQHPEMLLRGLIKDLMSGYSGDGDHLLSTWKEESDKLFGKTQAVKVWELLDVHNFLPDINNGLVLASLSGNNFSHEMALWQYENKRRLGSQKFIVSDLVAPNLSVIRQDDLPTFHVLRADGFSPPLKDNSIDVFWSRKGELWYAAFYESMYDDFGGLTNQVLKDICRTVKPGGILVLDSIKGFWEYRSSLDLNRSNSESNDLSLRFPNAPDQYEPSTIDMINIADPSVWELAQEQFDIFDIGEGSTQVRVLRKI